MTTNIERAEELILRNNAPGMNTYTPATIEHYGLLPSDLEADNV